jgi:hypothetical protein
VQISYACHICQKREKKGDEEKGKGKRQRKRLHLMNISKAVTIWDSFNL